MALEKKPLLINRRFNMYNVTMIAKIEHLDGKKFSENIQTWANVPYEGILFLQEIGLEGLKKLLEETAKRKAAEQATAKAI